MLTTLWTCSRPSTASCSPGSARVHELLPQRFVENLVDERALARSRCAGNSNEGAEREGNVHVLQVVLARLTDRQRPAITLPAPGWRFDFARAGEVLAGGRSPV